MKKYYLSLEGQKSLRHISDYSNRTFGKKRAKVYLQDIRDHIQRLANNPSLGIVRHDLKIGYHSCFVGSHTIYYRIMPDHIEIIDVLHQSMEPSRHII